MKTLKTFKALPLIAVLATGLALAPAASMADQKDHGHGKDRVYQKHDGHKNHARDGKHHKPGKFNRGHGQVKHVYNTHRKPGHKHHGYTYHTHSHGYHDHGHRHVDTVVVHDHHDYDPFRLLLGLHFDNVDIIYRDF